MRKYISIMILIWFVLCCYQSEAQTWSAAKRLTWTINVSEHPDVVIDSNNNIHFVWEEWVLGGYFEIFYKNSSDGGVTWSSSKRLTWNSISSEWPVIAVDLNDVLYVFWHGATTGGDYELFLKKSTDGGIIWSQPKRLTWNSGNSSFPTVAFDSNNHLHMVWGDLSPGNSELLYKKSTDGGNTWTGTKRLTWTPGLTKFPALVIDSSDTLHLVYINDKLIHSSIYHKKSWDGGGTWSSPIRITWDAGQKFRLAMKIDTNDVIHLVWDGNSPGNYEIFYKQCVFNIRDWVWFLSKRLTWNSIETRNPDIAVFNGTNVCVVWSDHFSTDSEIISRICSGAVWNPAQRLTYSSGDSDYPTIDADSGNDFHVLWQENLSSGCPEIFL